MKRKQAVVCTAVVCAAIATACGIPQDPEDTLARIQGGVVRVGVVNNPPWASLTSSDEAAGVEPQLVRALAAELDARVEWVPGAESELLAALEHHSLDLVIGGLPASSPWKPKLGFSRPYYTDTLIVAGARGSRVRHALRGVRVGVEKDRAGAAALESRGAVPVPVAHPATFPGPVAAPAWRLTQFGRAPAGVVLGMEKRVFAAAPGENGWLVRVERFLHQRRDSIPIMLRREGR